MTATSQTSPVLWALTDDRPGNNAQVLGVAQALGWTVVEKPIRYTAFARLPNIIRRATLAGVTDDCRAQLAGPWPDVVIAAGRRAAPVARWIKRQTAARPEGPSRLVQIMFPGRVGAGDFDLIVVPDHDAKPKVKTCSNVMTVTGAPSLITPTLLAEESRRWRDRFDSLPRPYIAVIVGGATRRKSFSTVRAFDLGMQVAELAKQNTGTVLLTTSRRTGKAAEQALMQVIPEPREIFTWGKTKENPYLGFLALADFIVVTGDSVTMCSEACATETPVYIYAPPHSVSAKHERLHQRLYKLGYAKPLANTLETWTHPPLNPSHEIANAVQNLVFGDPPSAA